MLKRLSPREQLENLALELEPSIRQAFLDAVREILSHVVLARLVDAISNGDVALAVRLLQIDADAFARVEAAIADAYNRGGQATVESLPRLMDPEGSAVRFTWGVRNQPAEQELRLNAARMVNGLAEDMRQGIAAHLSEGLARGSNPHVTARAIVGIKNRVTGVREGSLIGLTSQQMETTAWIRKALQEGDTARMREYLGLKLRDKRFDRSILAAIRDGKKLSAEAIDKVTRQYASRALDYRAKRLARTETFNALSLARDAAYSQQIATGKLFAEDVTKTWKHTPRDRPRMQHVAMNGQTVGFNEDFTAPDGTRIKHPHAPGTPMDHVIGCACLVEYDVDFTGRLLRRYRPN